MQKFGKFAVGDGSVSIFGRWGRFYTTENQKKEDSCESSFWVISMGYTMIYSVLGFNTNFLISTIPTASITSTTNTIIKFDV